MSSYPSPPRAQYLIVVVAFSFLISYFAVDYFMKWEAENLEEHCLQRISQGIIYYECRQYWNLCPFYFQDCNTNEFYEWDCKPNGTCTSNRVP